MLGEYQAPGFWSNAAYYAGTATSIAVGVVTGNVVAKATKTAFSYGCKKVSQYTAKQTLKSTAAKEFKNVASKVGKEISKALPNTKLNPLDAASRAGAVLDKREYAKVGRGLQKHGDRPNSVFPKATGTPAQINQKGQFILDDILTHPQGYSKSNRFGGIDYHRPDGAGARFYKDGEFRGFLEPPL